MTVVTEDERDESQHVEQETDHRPGIVAGSRLTDQPVGRRRRFGEGQEEETGEPGNASRPARIDSLRNSVGVAKVGVHLSRSFSHGAPMTVTTGWSLSTYTKEHRYVAVLGTTQTQ